MTAKQDFGRIFKEIAQKKEYSESVIDYIVNVEEWNSLNVIKISEKIGEKPRGENLKLNQKHRAYDEQSVKEILNYQKINNLNNSEMMRLFNISRNSIAKWKKMFSEN